jgi:hypothetical protein
MRSPGSSFPVPEVIVASTGDVSDACERASTRAAPGQQRHVVSEVVADERKCLVCETRRQRPGCGFIGSDRIAGFVDALQHNLVLAYVQYVAVPAPHRLNANFGGPLQVVERCAPGPAYGLAILLTERLGIRAHADGMNIELTSDRCAREASDHGRVADSRRPRLGSPLGNARNYPQ